MNGTWLACVVLASALAALPAGPAQGDDREWRFSLVRHAVGFSQFDSVSGGGDLTGDGIDDVVAGLGNEPEEEAHFVARVVSGAARDSWVSGREPSELGVRGLVDADGRLVRICPPQVVGDLTGDGIDELLIQTCPSGPDPREFRAFVVFGSREGGEVRLGELGGAGFELDVPQLGPDGQARFFAALADVGGSPGVAIYVGGPEPSDDQVRVYRLTASGVEPWAEFEGVSGPLRDAGDFFGDGGSDLLVVEFGARESVAYVVRVPSAPQAGARRVGDLGADEVRRVGFAGNDGSGRRGGLVLNGVGDVDGDGFDDVAVGGRGIHDEYVGSQSVVLGGAPSDQGEPRRFAITGYFTTAAGEPAGDLDGDGVDDLLLPGPYSGFAVVYGSRSVEPVAIDFDRPSARWTVVAAPLAALAGLSVAGIGGPDPEGRRVATVAGGEFTPRGGVLLFEPPRLASRRGVAFDGDPATVERVAGDAAELADVEDAAVREAVAQAVEVSRRAVPGSGADHVVLASAETFADALSASPLLGRGPLLLTPSSALPGAVRAEVDRVLPFGGTVYVVGGPAAVSETATAELERCVGGYDQCYRVQRVAGATRVETAAAVARLPGAVQSGRVAVARAYGAVDGSGADVTGAGWADAVTAGGWAAATGTPVLLTPSGEGLHPVVAETVAELGVSSTVVLGGTAAVSEQAAAQLPGMIRVAGRDRAETAAAIAGQLWPPGTTRRILVDGYRADGWTVGLPAAALAADGDAPLLLSQGHELPAATAEALRACSPDEPADVLLVGPAADGPDTLPSAVVAAQRC